MSGTKAGGIKARKTNFARHGDDFYKRIGAKGGRNSTRGPEVHYFCKYCGKNTRQKDGRCVKCGVIRDVLRRQDV